MTPDFFFVFEQIVNNPVLVTVAGFAFGLAIVSFIVGELKKAITGEIGPARKFQSPPVQPQPMKTAAPPAPRRREPVIDPNLCRYCGSRLEPKWHECPKCGGPRG